MAYVLIAVVFLVVCALSASMLWGIIRLFGEDMAFRSVCLTVMVAELLSLIPSAGWIISVVAYYYLLYKLSSINSVFMCWIITIAAKLCGWALLGFLLSMFT